MGNWPSESTPKIPTKMQATKVATGLSSAGFKNVMNDIKEKLWKSHNR
jgi:hypothetical protein